MTLATRARHVSRRARQTLSVFDNGWDVARQMTTSADELTFEVDGLTIHCPNAPGARVPVYEVFAEDEYAVDWFLAGIDDTTSILDIGAHIGCFSMDVTRRRPGARVHSYEPTPSTYAFTARNIESNHLSDRVTVHNEAVGATQGTLVMADNGAGSGHNGVLHLGEEGAVSIEVPCQSLAGAFSLFDAPVEVVKLDAEGAEYDIILNSDPALWSSVRRLVMEYHPSPNHVFDDLLDFLGQVGLSVVRHETGGPGFGLAWFSREPLA